MKVNRLEDLRGSARRNWLPVVAGVALGVSVFAGTGPSVTLAQGDDGSVEGLIDQIFAEVFGGGGASDASDSGGDINVGGNMGSSVTMGGGSGSGISIGGGSGGRGGGGMSSGPYNGG